ncbi:MAG: hypothetical protein ACOYIR_02320 [Christensenellales bacterium]
MEYLIGAILGGAIALIGALIGGFSPSPKSAKSPVQGEAQLRPDGRSENLLRQWNNLLSYCGKEQHDDI